MLKRCLAFALCLAFLLAGCAPQPAATSAAVTTPDAPTATPTPVPTPSPTPTPLPTPTPTLVPQPEADYMAMVEGLAPERTFVDMPANELATYEALFNGDYQVFGRSAGPQQTYIIAVRRDDVPIPGDFYEMSAYSRADASGESLCLTYYDEDANEHLLYELGEMILCETLRDGRPLESFCLRPMAEFPLDSAFNALFDPTGRALMALFARRPYLGFSADDKPQIDVLLHDEETATIYSAPMPYTITLSDAELTQLMPLLDAAETLVEGLESYTSYGHLRKLVEAPYDLGVVFRHEGKRYALFGNGNVPGHIVVSHGETEDIIYSEEAYALIAGKVAALIGYDIAAFTPAWFDEPLASATLAYDNMVSDDGDGFVWARQTQTVTDAAALEDLRATLRDAVQEFAFLSGCPYTAPLTLTRADGQTLHIMVATDGCDSMAVLGNLGFVPSGLKKALRAVFPEAITEEP